MKVGFIGLGAMGLPMARRVAGAGYQVVTTYHRRREPADELAALGATIVETPADVARQAGVIITIVPADAELKETALAMGFRYVASGPLVRSSMNAEEMFNTVHASHGVS